MRDVLFNQSNKGFRRNDLYIVVEKLHHFHHVGIFHRPNVEIDISISLYRRGVGGIGVDLLRDRFGEEFHIVARQETKGFPLSDQYTEPCSPT